MGAVPKPLSKGRSSSPFLSRRRGLRDLIGPEPPTPTPGAKIRAAGAIGRETHGVDEGRNVHSGLDDAGCGDIGSALDLVDPHYVIGDGQSAVSAGPGGPLSSTDRTRPYILDRAGTTLDNSASASLDRGHHAPSRTARPALVCVKWRRGVGTSAGAASRTPKELNKKISSSRMPSGLPGMNSAGVSSDTVMLRPSGHHRGSGTPLLSVGPSQFIVDAGRRRPCRLSFHAYQAG
jgi:hypothetical protein